MYSETMLLLCGLRLCVGSLFEGVGGGACWFDCCCFVVFIHLVPPSFQSHPDNFWVRFDLDTGPLGAWSIDGSVMLWYLCQNCTELGQTDAAIILVEIPLTTFRKGSGPNDPESGSSFERHVSFGKVFLSPVPGYCEWTALPNMGNDIGKTRAHQEEWVLGHWTEQREIITPYTWHWKLCLCL